MEFDTIQKGVDFYERYSNKAGFDMKRGGQKTVEGVLLYKYLLCSREGEGKKHNGALNERKRFSKRIQCKAALTLQLVEGSEKFFVRHFNPIHNHPLLTDDTMHMSKSKRKLDYFDKSVICDLTKNNIGPAKAHAIITSFKGGFEVQGPKYTDYKNWTRDLKCYVGDSDAQSLVDLMIDRKENVSNFSFYHFCKDSFLYGCLWVDDIGKKNYAEFGDIVSIDATYQTNK